MINIFSFPYKLANNQYIEQQRSVWESLGWKVNPAPTNLFDFIKCFKLKGVERRNKWIILNWFEDAPSQNKFITLKFITCCVYLILIKIVFGKVIWIKHNFIPHNKKCIFYYRILSTLLSHLSNVFIVHRPIGIPNETYISHPTYPIKNIAKGTILRDIDYLVFGSINKYKGVEELLKVWPQNTCLYIAGKCSDQKLKKSIEEIIVKRFLNVNWENRFISDSELQSYIFRTKTVILSHTTDEMIVSGVFFHAASMGANILQNENSFSKWSEKEFSFSKTFTFNNLEETMKIHTLLEPNEIIKALELIAGKKQLMKKWKGLTNKK